MFFKLFTTGPFNSKFYQDKIKKSSTGKIILYHLLLKFTVPFVIISLIILLILPKFWNTTIKNYINTFQNQLYTNIKKAPFSYIKITPELTLETDLKQVPYTFLNIGNKDFHLKAIYVGDYKTLNKSNILTENNNLYFIFLNDRICYGESTANLECHLYSENTNPEDRPQNAQIISKTEIVNALDPSTLSWSNKLNISKILPAIFLFGLLISIIITVTLMIIFFFRVLLLLIIISISGVHKIYEIDTFKLATVAVIGTYYIYFIMMFIPGISHISGLVRYIISAIIYIIILKSIYKDQKAELELKTAKDPAQNRNKTDKATR